VSLADLAQTPAVVDKFTKPPVELRNFQKQQEIRLADAARELASRLYDSNYTVQKMVEHEYAEIEARNNEL
jgi:hypothetical protein